MIGIGLLKESTMNIGKIIKIVSRETLLTYRHDGEKGGIMVAYYKYSISFIPSIYTNERQTMTLYALDDKDLQVQFYEEFHHLDYEIIHKDRIVVND